ncbi:flavin reductase family protein [Nonomuraea sp. NPDC026600]|uniref:flavin reductase family protein n=1 Tax=Nonomuraea sp. NPDC026600 TaxID=3155363 RepID=UPI0034008AA0
MPPPFEPHGRRANLREALVPRDRFRDALATVATAVSVVATFDEGGRPRMVTIGSLCSLSLAPPLVLFCLAKDAGSHAVFCSAARFAVTVLAEDQADVARRCAGPRQARTAVPYALMDELPVVPGALAHLSCSVHALVAGGDHTIVIGLVRRAAVYGGSPLLYHQRDFRGLGAPGGLVADTASGFMKGAPGGCGDAASRGFGEDSSRGFRDDASRGFGEDASRGFGDEAEPLREEYGVDPVADAELAV